jgi:hypothetical protein
VERIDGPRVAGVIGAATALRVNQPASQQEWCYMRVLDARWIGVVLLAVGVIAAAGEANAAEGRWKLGGDGECYFDAADAGPNQCFPMQGRWKLGGDGNCYFDANDGGLDQCAPVEATAAAMEPGDSARASDGTEVAVPAAALEPGTGSQLRSPGSGPAS